MKNTGSNTCAYCHKQFNKSERPFTPVKSDVSYHWKCYIDIVKEKSDPIYTFEEAVDEVYEEVLRG